MSLYDIKKKLEILNLFEKSTNAMKLVSLSLYHQLKKLVFTYNKNFSNNTHFLKTYFTIKSHIENNDTVYVFIASDRGFCGDYVYNMLHTFQEIYKKNMGQGTYIIIGKNLINKIKKTYKAENIIDIAPFKINTFSTIYEKINTIINTEQTALLKIYFTKSTSISTKSIENDSFYNNHNDYTLDKNISIVLFNKEKTLKPLINHCLREFIFYILHNALFSEQGARFIAMDSALKNTHEAIELNNKLYFKVRQQKINNQLQDLVSSLL
jgi:ATP synthase F1 gamma subunit